MRRPMRTSVKQFIDQAGKAGISEEETAKYSRTSRVRVRYIRAEEANKNVEVIYK